MYLGLLFFLKDSSVFIYFVLNLVMVYFKKGRNYGKYCSYSL